MSDQTTFRLRQTLGQIRELCNLAAGHPDIHGTDGQALPEAAIALIDAVLDKTEEAKAGD